MRVTQPSKLLLKDHLIFFLKVQFIVYSLMIFHKYSHLISTQVFWMSHDFINLWQAKANLNI